MMRLFKFINLRELSAEFYGDQRFSPAESRLRSIDADRGFIYIAWAPFFKDIWKEDLLNKSFIDCVKIGYSDDPERRKDEIAGNICPPESIEIIDYFPVFEMKKAENLVHRKLNKFRILGNREMFGLTQDEAKTNVKRVLDKYQQQSIKTKLGKGF